MKCFYVPHKVLTICLSMGMNKDVERFYGWPNFFFVNIGNKK